MTDDSGALTYPEVGATGDVLPPGYRHVRRVNHLGHGDDVFQRAGARLLSWDMHRRAGLIVDASTPHVTVGATVRLGWALGPFRIWAPCRVVWVADDPDERGFAYGTLAGHAERGEERFVVHRSGDDQVWLTITAFSRPVRWFSRLGGPVAQRVQDRILDRYAAALEAAQ